MYGSVQSYILLFKNYKTAEEMSNSLNYFQDILSDEMFKKLFDSPSNLSCCSLENSNIVRGYCSTKYL